MKQLTADETAWNSQVDSIIEEIFEKAFIEKLDKNNEGNTEEEEDILWDALASKEEEASWRYCPATLVL